MAAMTFTEWRRTYAPRLRRTRPTAITHSGQSRTVVSCLCGDTHTYATKWPVPAHAQMWRARHDVTCRPAGVVALRCCEPCAQVFIETPTTTTRFHRVFATTACRWVALCATCAEDVDEDGDTTMDANCPCRKKAR